MLFFQAALHCEIKVLKELLSLKKVQERTAFPIFCHEEFVLVVSGVGKVRAAAALSYALSCFQKKEKAICLNIGVAGHKTLLPGEGFLVGKVLDAETSQEFFPGILPKWKLSSLITVNKPEKLFQSSSGYDMEASGFFEIGKLFCPTDLLFSYKIVSDGPEHPFSYNAKGIEALMESQKDSLIRLIEDLKELKKYFIQPYSEELLEKFYRKWKFTFSEKEILKSLLAKRFALQGSFSLWDPAFEKLKSTKELFIELMR